MRVGIEPGIKSKTAVGPVDVYLLVEDVKTEPVPVKDIDPFAPVDPRPASAVIECGPRVPEHSGNGEIGDISGDWVPVGERKVLIMEHLANHSLKLIKHEPVPRQEVPLLVVLRVGGIVGVGLAPVPHSLSCGLILL